MKPRLSQNIRAKIAFEIFSSDITHHELADKYKVSRSLISLIAVEYGVQRHARYNQDKSPRQGKPSTYTSHDIETVNWTHDDELIMKRIKRREDNIQEEISRLVKAAVNL